MKYKCVKIFSILILMITFINLNIGFVVADPGDPANPSAGTPQNSDNNTTWNQENMHLILSEYRTAYDFEKLNDTLDDVNRIKITYKSQTDAKYNTQEENTDLKNAIIAALEGEKSLRQYFESRDVYKSDADNEKKSWKAVRIADFLNIKYKYNENWHGVNQSVEVLKAWQDTIEEAIQKNEEYIKNASNTPGLENFRLNIIKSYNSSNKQLDLDIKSYEDALKIIESSPNPEFQGARDVNDKIYKKPLKNTTTNNINSSLDQLINDADNFINQENTSIEYDETALQNFSKSLYNIAMSVGVIVAVGVGLIIGIKLMSESIERKVEANKLLVPYVVGCVIVFGGFTIWKLVIEILQQV